jgi:GntR family transcriptional regulator
VRVGASFWAVAERKVDKDLDVPLYQQIADIIRADIQSGALEPRRPVPSITTLTQRYDVARETAAQAIHTLADEGLVHRVEGRGWFVRSK